LGTVAQRASDLARVAPHHLGVVPNVFDPAGLAVLGECAGAELRLFLDPVIDHGFGAIISARSGPQILALRVCVLRIVGRMFEAVDAA